MGKFFSIDSPLMRFLTKITDLMILNLLFLVTSIPVVTIGAAWTSLYYVTLKMVHDDETGIIRDYFRAFRLNFRQATVLWLGVMVAVAVLAVDLVVLARIDSPVAAALNTGIAIIGLLLLMVLQYLFPLLAKFDTTILNAIRNAFLSAIAHLPKTILMVVFEAGCLLITLYNGYTLSIGIIVWMMLGFAMVAFGNSGILVKILDSYISTEATKNQ